MVAGSLYQFFQVSDRTVVATLGETKSVGDMTLATNVSMVFSLVNHVVSSIMYTSISTEYGRTKSRQTLLAHLPKCIANSAIVSIPVAFILWFSIEPAVKLYMPAYVVGIDTAKVAIVTGCSTVLMSPAILIAIYGKNIYYSFSIGVAVVLMWLLNIYIGAGGVDVRTVVINKCILSYLLGAVTLMLAIKMLSPEGLQRQSELHY
jgi:hypothetical protein